MFSELPVICSYQSWSPRRVGKLLLLFLIFVLWLDEAARFQNFRFFFFNSVNKRLYSHWSLSPACAFFTPPGFSTEASNEWTCRNQCELKQKPVVKRHSLAWQTETSSSCFHQSHRGTRVSRGQLRWGGDNNQVVRRRVIIQVLSCSSIARPGHFCPHYPFESEQLMGGLGMLLWGSAWPSGKQIL